AVRAAAALRRAGPGPGPVHHLPVRRPVGEGLPVAGAQRYRRDQRVQWLHRLARCRPHHHRQRRGDHEPGLSAGCALPFYSRCGRFSPPVAGGSVSDTHFRFPLSSLNPSRLSRLRRKNEALINRAKGCIPMEKHAFIIVLAVVAVLAFIYLLVAPPAEFSALEGSTQLIILRALFMVAEFPITILLIEKFVRGNREQPAKRQNTPSSDHLPRPTL